MRQIKFRAWDVERKQMVTDFVLAPTAPTWSAHLIRENEELSKIIHDYFLSKGDILSSNSYTVLDWSDYYGISNYKIMQFTGLYDCEGTPIYEGDIVEASWGYSGIVEFHNIIYSAMECTISDDIKVIGNKFEHKSTIL